MWFHGSAPCSRTLGPRPCVPNARSSELTTNTGRESRKSARESRKSACVHKSRSAHESPQALNTIQTPDDQIGLSTGNLESQLPLTCPVLHAHVHVRHTNAQHTEPNPHIRVCTTTDDQPTIAPDRTYVYGEPNRMHSMRRTEPHIRQTHDRTARCTISVQLVAGINETGTRGMPWFVKVC